MKQIEKPKMLERIKAILRAEETADLNPPYRCLPIDDTKWIELKALRIEPIIQQAKVEVAREIRFQILEWFRNYAHQLDRKFPNPTTEEQGWLGNIWDMIHIAGKEDFESKYQEEK